jgi:hypothetical protein
LRTIPGRILARANVPPVVRTSERAQEAYVVGLLAWAFASGFGGTWLIMQTLFSHLPWRASHLFAEYALLSLGLHLWMRGELRRLGAEESAHSPAKR